MKTRISSTLLVGAALTMGWTFLTALGCGGDFSITYGSKPECTTYQSDNFPNLSGSLTLSQAGQCPVKFFTGMDVPYNATANLNGQTFAPYFFRSDVVTWNGYLASTNVQPVWSITNSGDEVVQISGTYQAGSGGFNPDPTGPQYDDVRNYFTLRSTGEEAYIAARIPYSYGQPSVAVSGSPLVEPYTQYNVTASASDLQLIYPTTWTWYVNGQNVGSSSDAQFTITSGDPNAQQEVYATATDVTGHFTDHGPSLFVTMTAGCGTQIQC